jgi:hypothetical protein
MAITRHDLRWWEDLATQLPWIWAVTYAATAPHDYVVEGRTPGLERADFVRAARVIHTFGQPGKFYASTNLYLTSEDNSVRWWTMDCDVRDTNLVNRAASNRLYGVQNAPATWSRRSTAFDEIATEYDQQRPPVPRLRAALAEAVTALGLHRPSVLDVGAGTGRLLDLGVTPPDRCAAVDPSGPMLNQLVRKHPSIGAVYPDCIEAILRSGTFAPGQFELVTVLDAELAPGTLDRLRQIASIAVLVVHGDDLAVLPSSRPRSGAEVQTPSVRHRLSPSLPS